MGSLSWLLCPLPRQSLITFVNKHLNKLNLEVTELETQVSCVLRGGTMSTSHDTSLVWQECPPCSPSRPRRPSDLLSLRPGAVGAKHITFIPSQPWRLQVPGRRGVWGWLATLDVHGVVAVFTLVSASPSQA